MSLTDDCDRERGQLMWYTGDGQLYRHDDRDVAEEYCESRKWAPDEPILVRVTPVEEVDDG